MIDFFEGVSADDTIGGQDEKMSSQRAPQYDCDGVDFIDSVEATLEYKGYSDSKFFICRWKDEEFLTKFSFYRKTNPEIYKANGKSMNPVDAEIAILKLLKKTIIDANISPCVLEILYSKKCSLKSLSIPPSDESSVANLPIVKARQHHYELCAAGIADPRFAYIVLEECDQTILRFVKTMEPRNSLDRIIFRSLFFQLMYTLRAIKHIYPSFRHNDLHSDNIMLLFIPDFDPRKPTYLQFIDHEGTTWNVPFFGMFLKIIDFGFSSIEEKGIVSSAQLDPSLMWVRPKNDLLFFMYDIYFASERNHSLKILFDTFTPLYSATLEHIRHHEKEFPPIDKLLRLYADYKKAVNPADIYAKYTNSHE